MSSSTSWSPALPVLLAAILALAFVVIELGAMVVEIRSGAGATPPSSSAR